MSEPLMLPGLVQWLASGERGVSSNTMVQHLTGLKTLDRWEKDHPHDPDDFDRCLQLLEAVPMMRPLLSGMRTASPVWAALVDNWEAIERSHLDEVGLRWTKGFSAPNTYALMRRVIESPKKKRQAA